MLLVREGRPLSITVRVFCHPFVRNHHTADKKRAEANSYASSPSTQLVYICLRVRRMPFLAFHGRTTDGRKELAAMVMGSLYVWYVHTDMIQGIHISIHMYPRYYGTVCTYPAGKHHDEASVDVRGVLLSILG
jgi:hypothetical protein